MVIPANGSVLIGHPTNGTNVPYLTAASAQQTSASVINFNGNDGIALLDASNNVIDRFGTGINAVDISYVRNSRCTFTFSHFSIGTMEQYTAYNRPYRKQYPIGLFKVFMYLILCNANGTTYQFIV